MARIFLCHASEDKAQVREVYHRLQAIEGFEPWLDEEDLLPGQDWMREIPRALQKSDFILVFFSRNSVAKRGYVQREMKLALDALQEIPEGTIHTIPVRLDDCEMPESFQPYHYANLFDPNGFDRIVRAIRVEITKRSGPTPPPSPQPSPRPSLPERPATQGHVGIAVSGISAGGDVTLGIPPEQLRGAILAVLREESLSAEAAELTEDTALEPLLTNSIGMEFVLIPAGMFMMGSPDSDAEANDNEKPAHRVTISQPFYLGKYPVTQAQWEAVMGTNPSQFTGDQNRPVERLSWEDTQEFIRRLNTREGGTRYRLPTEAEWEYACRAGSQTSYSFGDEPAHLDAYGWYSNNSGNIFSFFKKTYPVGQRQPNAWGLYDMHGNVWEWVQDGYGAYTPEPVTDPRGPASGLYRIIRGGSWINVAGFCRSAFRLYVAHGYCDGYVGFRLLRTAQ